MTDVPDSVDSTDSNGRLFDEKDRRTFEAAVDAWGIDAQASMAEEEAAEFIVASKHWARSQHPNGVGDVIDELADLRIMSEQLTEYIGREAVEERVEQKMDRLRERLPDDAANSLPEPSETSANNRPNTQKTNGRGANNGE